MFKITKLVMRSLENEEFTYFFKEGINYFKGKNNSGKTEFYKFMDYMLGASNNISNCPWYKGTLKQATMELVYDNISYILTRGTNPEKNYLYYKDEQQGECISSREYRDKLNAIFTKNQEDLKDIRKFADENLTYRAFTMFNFLGEKRQGNINDFLDKCSILKYALKLNPILNFVFNKNLELISKLREEMLCLEDEIKGLEKKANRYEFVCNKINRNLMKLNIDIRYNGKNTEEIKVALDNVKRMEVSALKGKKDTIAELEVIFNNLDEQIKIYEQRILDSKKMSIEKQNRKKLLEKLESIIDCYPEIEYLATPITSLVGELENSISFSNYIINDNTIQEVKKQRKQIKEEIIRNDYRFKRFNIEEKTKAIVVIEDYLEEKVEYSTKDLEKKKKRVRQLKEEIKILQNADDVGKIQRISDSITELYKSADSVADIVRHDVKLPGFYIQYIKRGNILQPMISNKEDDSSIYGKYYTGSMARHTLIQLCGYLCFLELLVKENKYPIIPILLIDHISKPFDQINRKAIGVILSKFYEKVKMEDIQIFMFDDESDKELLIANAKVSNLIEDGRSGFNPFYHDKEK